MSQSRGGVSLTRVRAVSRAVAILNAFSREEPWLPLRSIAEHTKLDPGTVRRILVTLCDENLVRQDTDSSRYALSSGVIAIANAAPLGNSLAELAAAALQSLARSTLSTVFLVVLKEGQMHCLSQISAEGAIEVRFPAKDARDNLAADHTGVLKVLFAFSQNPEILSRLSGSLDAELDQIRAQGWHLAEDTPIAGLSAVAVPVLLENQCVAAVSVTGLSPHLTARGYPPQCLQALRDCCGLIESALQLNPGVAIA